MLFAPRLLLPQKQTSLIEHSASAKGQEQPRACVTNARREDLVGALSFLTSDDAAFVTRQTSAF